MAAATAIGANTARSLLVLVLLFSSAAVIDGRPSLSALNWGSRGGLAMTPIPTSVNPKIDLPKFIGSPDTFLCI